MLFRFTGKGEKDLIKNHRPVSLLAIFGKNFGRLIFNFLFKYIDENELLNPNSQAFVHLVLVQTKFYINHAIFSNFDCGPPKDIRTVILDISKAFDKI